jgi:hypothetical protein
LLNSTAGKNREIHEYTNKHGKSCKETKTGRVFEGNNLENVLLARSSTTWTLDMPTGGNISCKKPRRQLGECSLAIFGSIDSKMVMA